MDTLKEIKRLLDELEGKNKILAEQTTRMFNLHNTVFPKQLEYGKSCSSCRNRVYKKLQNYYNIQIQNGNE
jgi:hypothetical protein